MSRFVIKPDNLRIQVGRFSDYSETLKKYSDEVLKTNDDFGIAGDISRSIESSLQVISNDLIKESNGCSNLSAGLSDSVQLYEKTEQSIIGTSQIKWGGIVSPDESKSSELAEKIFDVYYKTVIAAAGPLGYLGDAIRRATEGKPGDVIGDVLKIIGGFAKNVEKTGINWGKWFGVNLPDKGPWESALGKYTDFSTAGKSISTVCNWAAEIAKSGYNNYKEFGNFGMRFWEETATESLLKIGEGVLITAAAGALLAPVGAPVLVVGAVAAGVTVLVDWGLDSVVNWVTGGTQTEWMEAASDLICDTGEAIVNGVKDVANAAVNGIKNTFENIGGAICKWGSFCFG